MAGSQNPVVTPRNPWLLVAAASGLVAVAASGYGWHGLAADAGAREVYTTGVQYQMWHSLALLAVAWLADRHPAGTPAGRWARLAGLCFAIGIVLFSGSMYFFGLFGEVPFPGAAPVGGFALMAGWASLAVAATRKG